MTPQEMQAEQSSWSRAYDEEEAWSKQYDAEQAAKKAQEQQEKQPQSFLQKWAAPVGKATLNMLDSAVSTADTMINPSATLQALSGRATDAGGRAGRDIAAGAATGAANIVDATNPGKALEAGEQMLGGSAPLKFDMPIWDHAKNAIMDFRDAVAVKDPTLADNLLQSVSQLALPFTGYSRALGGLHGFANVVAAGAATDATALAPHDMRMSDMIALGRHTEGKLGDVLRTLAPDGSALNAYITYLTDRSNEGEAEGRFKNVLDGFGVNLVATPLISAVASTLKQGQIAVRQLADQGIGSLFDLGPAPGSRAAQEGKIVFHGTAADFNAFDDAKIGTGEGNQTFGYGHYFAENPETAGHYQQMLIRRNGATGVAMSDAGKAVDKYGGRAEAYSELNQQMHAATDPAVRANLAKQMSLIRSGNYERGKGNLLHVEIPDEHIDNMVHWDQPINQQPKLQKVIDNLDVKIVPEGNNFRVMLNGKPAALYADSEAASRDTFFLRGAGLGSNQSGNYNASMFYDQLSSVLGSPKAASEFLSRRGITGIKYFDQGSRDAGEGTHNLVLFNAKHARIVAKNGEGVRPPLKQGGADPMEAEAERQARIDADSAARNPNGKRPPLKQGGRDLMEALAAEQARADAARHVVMGK